MKDKIKIKVSTFVANILENDALRFGFKKNGKSNKNALLNKLIPTMVAVKKTRRDEIENTLKNEYNRSDSENIFNAVSTIIDKVYFGGEDLNVLEEYIWIRPSKETLSTYDEIETSETRITAQETTVYIRNLLNEYACLPQYKREMLTFDKELDVFSTASCTQQIIHFTNNETNEKFKAFAFDCNYGYLYEQTNYCIFFDINNKIIKAIPPHNIQNIYALKQKYKPSNKLIKLLQDYSDDLNFKKEIIVED